MSLSEISSLALHNPDFLISLQIRLEYELDAQDRLIVCPGSEAAAQFHEHRLAFYSHKATNLPSLALRQSLCAVPFANSIAWE